MRKEESVRTRGGGLTNGEGKTALRVSRKRKKKIFAQRPMNGRGGHCCARISATGKKYLQGAKGSHLIRVERDKVMVDIKGGPRGEGWLGRGKGGVSHTDREAFAAARSEAIWRQEGGKSWNWIVSRVGKRGSYERGKKRS